VTFLKFAALGWLVLAIFFGFIALVAAAVSINALVPLGGAALISLLLGFTLARRPGTRTVWIALVAALLLVVVMFAAVLTAQDAFRGESTWALGLTVVIALLTVAGLWRISSQSSGS
jgi:hypothetical protein